MPGGFFLKILITGSSGQLALEFQEYLERSDIDFLALPRSEFDITDHKNIRNIINDYKPTHILNCAAYNLVDDAQDNSRQAFAVNSDAVEILAQESNRIGSFFVHFSTDYVFDGLKEDLYIESDKTNPINEYGKSKLSGELKALEADKSLVFRLSWVIGKGKQNFLYKLSQWIKGSKTLRVSADAVSVPSFTFDIVEATMKALKENLKGLYHLSNSGYASRYELAKCFLEFKNKDNILIPVQSDFFRSKAKRPLFTPMSNKKIKTELNIEIPYWKDSLEKHCKKYDY